MNSYVKVLGAAVAVIAVGALGLTLLRGGAPPATAKIASPAPSPRASAPTPAEPSQSLPPASVVNRASAFVRPFTYALPRFGYVLADQPSTASYTPSATYSHNGQGAASINTITRSATGRYQVRFPNLGGTTGAAVQVTASGTGTQTCRATGWQASANGLDEVVDVACHTAGGAGADAPFTLSFHERDGMLGVPTQAGAPRGYVVSDQEGAAIHTPSTQYNSAGGVNRISRESIGVYRVRLPDLATPGGHVQVGAYLPSADSRRCKVAGWSTDGADEVVTVRCFDASGTVADARFVMSFAV